MELSEKIAKIPLQVMPTISANKNTSRDIRKMAIQENKYQEYDPC